MTLAAGTTFGPYEIRSRLGSGGMGEVYLAHDARLRRDVALKVLPAADRTDPSARRRLLAEARLGARLEHPGIAAIYEVGEHDGRDYIAMQRIAGTTLDAHAGDRPIEEPVALDLAIQIAEAISHAHASGVIHRDLKPANVMITPQGRAVVLDFGLARGPLPAGPSETSDTRTAAGFVAGTPAAMSPEQARGEPLDARTDVFSFGTILHRMLTGREPFAGGSIAETIAAVLTRDPPPMASIVPGVRPALQGIVDRCLAKNRDQRYASMRDVLADLQRARAGASGGATAVTTGADASKRSPRRGRRLVLGAVALATVLLAAILWRRGSPPGEFHSLAILPFRSLAADSQQNYLGLGIADAVISRLSGDSGLVVRPTSAVRRYATTDADAARAGAELKVDAVLEGTWQQESGRLRVTANLLRRRDGASLWSDRFDATSQDIFDIQDQIAEQLAMRLRSGLAAREGGVRELGGTRNPKAYAAYAKGLFYFSERGYDAEHRQSTDLATTLFGEAVELDPRYALAHAQLAYVLVWTADFIELDSTLIRRAEEELATAEAIEPRLGLVHLVRGMTFYTQFRGWRIDDAIAEYKRAEQLGSPQTAEEFAQISMHLGLESMWHRSHERLLAQDPTNRRERETYVNEAFLLSLPEVGLRLQKELLHTEPDLRYWFLVRDLGRAGAEIEKVVRAGPDDPEAHVDLAVLLAAQKRCGEADSLLRIFAPRLSRNLSYHHMTFECAQVHALCGNAREAVRWLDETVRWGFPCYPLFERDWCLDPIRKDPEFVAFMSRLRPVWERYRSELGE